MILKSELRHNSVYLVDGKMFKYTFQCENNFSDCNNYVLGIEGLPFTHKIFKSLSKELRRLFDISAKHDISVRVCIYPGDEYYTFVSDDVNVKEIRYLHDLQNLIWILYEEELNLIDEKVGS